MSRLIAICLKRSLAPELAPRPVAGGSGLHSEDGVWRTDRASLSALALGLSLAGAEDQVLALAVGPLAQEEPLREALAAGVHKVLRIWRDDWPLAAWQRSPDGSATHTYHVALMAAEALSTTQPPPALVLAGASSMDTGHGTFAATLAMALERPFAHCCTHLRPADGSWIARVKLERGFAQEFPLTEPAVASIDATLPAPPRATLPAWIASRQATVPVTSGPAPYPVTVGTHWRKPVPRVKYFHKPPPQADAEARIQMLVSQPAGAGTAGGTLIPREVGPSEQARACLKFLNERGLGTAIAAEQQNNGPLG